MRTRLALLLLLATLAGCEGAEPVGDEPRERPRAGEDTKRQPAREAPRKTAPRRRQRRAPPPALGRRRDVVVRVVDGDTIELARLGTVRLIGVDTPEVYGGLECFGRAASEFTKRLLPSGARVRFDWDLERRDRYGRALVYLYRGARFVNAELVRTGFAQPYTIAPNVSFAERFVALSRRARELRRGLWASARCAASESRPRSCADFATHAQAQRYFRHHRRAMAGLDGDDDGRVCEALP